MVMVKLKLVEGNDTDEAATAANGTAPSGYANNGTGPVGLLVEAMIPEHFVPATYKSFYRRTHLPNPIIFY